MFISVLSPRTSEQLLPCCESKRCVSLKLSGSQEPKVGRLYLNRALADRHEPHSLEVRKLGFPLVQILPPRKASPSQLEHDWMARTSPLEAVAALFTPFPLLSKLLNRLLRRSLTTVRRPVKVSIRDFFVVPVATKVAFAGANLFVVGSVCAFAAPVCGGVSGEEVFEPGEHF